jgi:hypothetical protein
MPNRFLVCLILPLVIWGASKVDVDLAFACFCSSLLYTVWAVLTTIAEAHERTNLDIQERNHRFQKQLWEHQREQSPPRNP